MKMKQHPKPIGNTTEIPKGRSYLSMCRAAFKDFSDADFYGSKATHVYFYNAVNEKSVQEFRKDLYNAQKVKNTNVKSKPKPIVVHIHSSGGDAHLGITLANFLRESVVPIAVVVDGYACSAITPLFVSGVYRVVHDLSFLLFHEGSIEMQQATKFGQATFLVAQRMSVLDDEYRKIYTANTKLPKDLIDEMLQRDLFMSAQTCMKYKVADRLISIQKEKSLEMWKSYVARNPEFNLPAEPLTWHIGLNHLYNYNNSIEIETGEEIFGAILTAVKPIQAVMQDASGSSPKPVVLHTNMYTTPYQSRWFDITPLLIRVFLMPTPVIGVIDSNIDLLQALPCVLAHRRYMYNNTSMYITLSHFHNGHNVYYHDIKANTDMLRNALKQILSKYTRLPQDRLDRLFEDRVLLSAKECKEYGLVDEIIEPFTRNEEHGDELDGGKAKSKKGIKGRKKPSVHQAGGCSCSQGLPIDYIDH